MSEDGIQRKDAERGHLLAYAIIVIVYAGTVFLTSSLFNNKENGIKYYFMLAGIQLLLIYICIFIRDLRSITKFCTSIRVWRSFFAIGVLQAVYGLLQFAGILPSLNNSFPITGSFENPAGFASVTVLVYPIGLSWIIKSFGRERIFVTSLSVILLTAVALSGSRTGILASLLSTVAVVYGERKAFNKFATRGHYIVVFILLLLAFLILYSLKTDSANGRLFVWKICSDMIKDHPLFGFGTPNGLKSHYMVYQAGYFFQNSDSRYAILADNIIHPFNEFLNITVNYGLLGLSVIIVLITIMIVSTYRHRPDVNNVCIGIWTSFFVLCSFTYPLHYAHVWFFIVMLSVTALSHKISRKSYRGFKASIVAICIVGCLLLTRYIHYEIIWNQAFRRYLLGQKKNVVQYYDKLYKNLSCNSMFLYNYGAILNDCGMYDKSIVIMDECSKQYNDYNVQMIQADNYACTGDTHRAISVYGFCSRMIPCRFLPLYEQMRLYNMIGEHGKADSMAYVIMDKTVKVPSLTVQMIRMEADSLLHLSTVP